MRSRRNLVHWIAIGVMSGMIIGAATPTLVRTWSGKKSPDDFAVVYSGARAMYQHEDIYVATQGMYIYSPFLAFIFQPLAAMPQRAASLTWTILSALIFAGSAVFGAAKVSSSWQSHLSNVDAVPSSVIAAGAVLLSLSKIRSDFTLGQTDCLIIAGLIASLMCFNRRPILAAAVIGVTANFKYLALIFIPYFVIKRNYRAALTAIVSFLFFFALPSVEVGFGLLKTYANRALAVIARVIGLQAMMPNHADKPIVNSVVWNHSISVTSTIFRVTRSHGISDLVAGILIVSLFVLLAGSLIFVGRAHGVNLFHSKNTTPADERAVTIEWATLIVLALAFGPQTTARHMIMLLPVFMVGIAIFLIQGRALWRIVLLTLMVAVSVTLLFPFRDTGVHPILISLKSIGIASWCAIGLMFAIVWTGSRAISTDGTYSSAEIPIPEANDPD